MRSRDLLQGVVGGHADAEAEADCAHYSAATRVSSPAAAISRRSHSGAMSKPLGHVGGAELEKDAAEVALATQGLEHGARLADHGGEVVLAGTAVAEADAQAKPPSFSRRVTLVSIETCNPRRLLARAGATPNLAQLRLTRQRPLLDQPSGRCRQPSVDHRLVGDVRFRFGIDRLKMRRWMISHVHADGSA
jgi:hypothetical protein